eukprot:6553550-Prymnesium_polylepis.1
MCCTSGFMTGSAELKKEMSVNTWSFVKCHSLSDVSPPRASPMSLFSKHSGHALRSAALSAVLFSAEVFEVNRGVQCEVSVKSPEPRPIASGGAATKYDSRWRSCSCRYEPFA